MVSLFLLLGCNLSYIVDLFAGLHELASASARTSLKARIIGARALKTLWRHLKLYLNSLVYHRNIFGSSSKVFGNLRQSLDIFGNFRKLSGNVRERSSGLWDNSGKSSEIFGKSSKTASSVYFFNKIHIFELTCNILYVFSII